MLRAGNVLAKEGTCLGKRTGSVFICNDVPVGSHKSVRHRGRQRGTERDRERESETRFKLQAPSFFARTLFDTGTLHVEKRAGKIVHVCMHA